VTYGMSGVYDGPGIYDAMTEEEYHSDPVPGGSLSASGCKTLLKSPAKFNHQRQPGNSVHKDVFDFGSAAHTLVLGVGAEIEWLAFDDYKTKAARTAKLEARGAGRTPMLIKDQPQLIAMADAIREHPAAAALLNPAHGKAEQSLFWSADGIQKRARLDWLPDQVGAPRFAISDYKTTPEDGAGPLAFARTAVDFSYHQQAAFYLEGVRVLLGIPDPVFWFIVQEKAAPYLVNVIELPADAMLEGQQRNDRAVALFKECTEADHWPGYGDQIDLAYWPQWASYQHADNLDRWQRAS
jgi:hypothetical protein